jgi:regulator of sigma E protease
MEILGQFFSNVSALPGYIIPFLFVLTVIVFFHELGHFMVARWCGVAIETFSIGFGREIFGFNDKHGTRWKFAWIPLGGYVKFLGDENAASVPDREKVRELKGDEAKTSFHNKPLSTRAAVVAAGPIANFILAIVIFAGIFMVLGKTITAPVVDKIQPDSVAANSGFQVGDVIIKIDGTSIEAFSDLQRIVRTSADKPLSFVVARNSKEVTLTATPKLREVKDRFGNIHRIGLLGVSRDTSKGNIIKKRYGPIEAVGAGAQETWFVVSRTMGYLYNIIVGREKADQLGGPMRIAQMSGQMATISFAALMNLAAVLSVSIGLINLFPVPMLDGGHLLFYGIEAVRGKPLSERVQEFGFRIGLALVIMLMIFATWNDLVHFDVF